MTLIPHQTIGILFCSLIYWQISAQTVTFQKTYGSTGNDFGSDVAVLADGYIIAGETAVSSTNSDAVLIRTDLNGEIIWQKTFGSTGYEVFRNVLAANDGGFVAWGSITSTITGHLEAWLVKVNDSGDVIWQKSWADDTSEVTASGDILASTEGYVVTLRFFRFNSPLCGSVFVRMDNQGNVVQSMGHTTGYDDLSNNYVAQYLTDTILYACGSSSVPSGLLSIYNATGGIKTIYQFDSLHQSLLTGLRPTSDGNLLMCGNIKLGQNGDNSTKLLLVKTRPHLGTVIWSMVYEIPGWSDHLPGMERTSDGNFILSIENLVGEAVLAKIDQNGNVLWTKAFGGPEFHNFYRPKPTADGGYVFAGNTTSGGQGNSDILLVKADTAGTIFSCTEVSKALIPANYNYQRLNNSLMYSFGGDVSGQSTIPTTNVDQLISADYCEMPLFLWFIDADGDSYGNMSVALYAAVQPVGYVSGPGDCDDTNPFIFPGATELPNGFDDNCDGQIDEGFVAVQEPGNGNIRLYPNPATSN